VKVVEIIKKIKITNKTSMKAIKLISGACCWLLGALDFPEEKRLRLC
jgi:hypothetical protein